MAQKVFEDVETKEDVVQEVTPHVKQMVRKIGNIETSTGALPSQVIDLEISQWIDSGWTLFATHYMASEPDGVTILYILVK
jgi:hypothetical protein